MHHDSHVDCNDVKRLPLEEVEQEINNDSNCFKGHVSDDLRAEIVTAIKVSPFLSPSEKKRYVEYLTSQ